MEKSDIIKLSLAYRKNNINKNDLIKFFSKIRSFNLLLKNGYVKVNVGFENTYDPQNNNFIKIPMFYIEMKGYTLNGLSHYIQALDK